MGSSTVCISALMWSSMGCRGTGSFNMVFSMICRDISAPVPGAPLPPLSSLTLVSAAFFSHIFLTHIFHRCHAVVLLFLKYVIIEVPPVYTEVPALASGEGWVSFGAIWNWLFSDIGQLLVSSYRGHCCSPMLPNPCHISIVQMLWDEVGP